MFNNFKAMGAVASLLKDRERLEATANRVRSRLEETRVEGESGGGAVRAVVSGTARVHAVHVEPAVGAGFGSEESRGMAERLIADAVNDGLEKARAAAQAIVEEEAQELGLEDLLPDLRKLLPAP
jgi:hypothetical protein